MMVKRSSDIRSILLLGIGLGLGIGVGAFPGPASAGSTTLYYTRYAGVPSVSRIISDYKRGDSVTYHGRQTIAELPHADDLIFVNRKEILVGGEDRIYLVDRHPGKPVREATGGGVDVFHVTMDLSQRRAWGGGIPGFLTEIPLEPFGDATVRFLIGDDTLITSLAFAADQAWYTVSAAPGFGNFGIIDLTTFTTQRLLANLPAAHGLIFDPYTGHLLLCGAQHITQFDPVARTVVSDLDLSSYPGLSTGANDYLDHLAPDGEGHVWAAVNNGHMVFVDYSASRQVNDPGNFVDVQFLETAIDSVAPIVGLGSPRAPREPSSPSSPNSFGFAPESPL